MSMFDISTHQLLPPVPSIEIPRGPLIRQIETGFSPDCQQQMVVGGVQTGKTNLLAQFVRTNSKHCVSYFINSSPLTQRQHAFLYSMCYQMSVFLETSSPPENISLEDLKSLFQTLSFRIATRSKMRDILYYFVIDGLEQALQGLQDERIIDLFPLQTSPRSPYLLCSCRSDQVDELPECMRYPIKEPLNFNRLETGTYLSDLELSSKEIDQINDKYQGVPGHLKFLKETKIANPSFNLKSAPVELDRLINKHIEVVLESSSPTTVTALETLASSPTSLLSKSIADFLETNETKIIEALQHTGLVNYDAKNSRVDCSNEFIRSIIRKRIGKRLSKKIKDLLNHIRDNYPNEEFLLTLLLKEAKDYEGLRDTLTGKAIISTIDTTGDMSSVIKRLRLASEMAIKNEKINDLTMWTLGIATVKSFLSHALNTDEIEALLSIGASRDALKRAYAIPETSIKVRLLARIYASQKERGVRVQKSALDELASMVNSINLENLDKEIAQKMAIDLLPVLPDVAFSLLEKVTRKVEERSIVEVAIGAVESRLEEQQREGELSVSEKTHANFGRIASLLSSWLNDLSLSKLIEELKSIENTKAKEYMLRQWCRQNKESRVIAKAIDLWLDTILEDRSFVVPLRNLRHISEVVIRVPLEKRKKLIERLRVPAFTAIDSPKQEWVRFHLNIAEALIDIDQEDAKEQIKNIYGEILQNSLDLDVKAFCFARLWGAVSKNFTDDSNRISDIQERFDFVFRSLLNDSAEQLEPVLETIQALIDVGPICALTAASELNTYFRRKRAVIVVLEATLRKLGERNISDFIENALQLLDRRERIFALDTITSKLNAREVVLALPNVNTLLRYSERIEDPAIKAITLSNIAGLFPDGFDNESLAIMERAIESWRKEEDLKIRLSLGFGMVQKTAKLDTERAKQLYKEVTELKFQPGSTIAIGDLGPMFRETVDLAIRAMTIKDFSESDEAIKSLEQLISRIPSQVVRTHLFAGLAASAYRVCYDPCAKKIVRTKVINSLDDIQSELDRDITISFCLPVIFEYDVSEAKSQSNKLSYPVRDEAWYSVVLWSLCRSFLGDHRLDPEDVRVKNDYPRLKKAVEAASEIDYDMLFCSALRAIVNCVKESFNLQIDLSQALDILQKLDRLASSKLPESNNNIEHHGYLILAKAYVHGVRSCVYHKAKRKRGLSKIDIGQQWQEITTNAKNISNKADRVFVMAEIAPEMIQYYTDDSSLAVELLEQADSQVMDIPTLADRIDRLQVIAKSWGILGNKPQAEVILEKAFELANKLRESSADDKLEMLVQAAYQLDSQFADDLVSRLDTRMPEGIMNPATLTFQVEKLRSAPTNINQLHNSLTDGAVLSKTARKLLRDFAANRGNVPHSSVLENWLMYAGFQSPRINIDVVHWVIESLYHKQATSSLKVFLDVAHLIDRLAGWISTAGGKEGIPEVVSDSYPALSARIVSFGAGEVERAQCWLQNWLSENVESYLKICDPYFGLEQLEYLTSVPVDCKILIVTTDAKLSVDKPPEKVKEELERYWKSLTFQTIPQIQFMMIPKRLGDRFHDRAIVTMRAGLDIGQSLNGIGKSRGKITVLSEEDAKELESVYVNAMLSNATWFMNGVRPTVLFLGD